MKELEFVHVFIKKTGKQVKIGFFGFLLKNRKTINPGLYIGTSHLELLNSYNNNRRPSFK